MSSTDTIVHPTGSNVSMEDTSQPNVTSRVTKSVANKINHTSKGKDKSTCVTKKVRMNSREVKAWDKSNEKDSPVVRRSLRKKGKKTPVSHDVDKHGNVRGLIDYNCDYTGDENELRNICRTLGRGKTPIRMSDIDAYKDISSKKVVKTKSSLGGFMSLKSSNESKEESHDTKKPGLKTKKDLEKYLTQCLIQGITGKNGRSENMDLMDQEFVIECIDGADEKGDEYTPDELEYLESLSKKNRRAIEKQKKQLDHFNKNKVPFRFRIMAMQIPDKTKKYILDRLETYQTMEPSDNEFHKLDKWIRTLETIPMAKYSPEPITLDDKVDEISVFLQDTHDLLNQSVFGHDEAKMRILQHMAQRISNPHTKGNLLAIQGPPGNGKTTLIKKGMAMALKRPFGFIALGGATESAFLEGHDYTWEGSHCGRILEIIKESQVMDPIIYFDELDKISETAKGEEIANLLCHLTDHTQNDAFMDRYFAGIDFDLSRVTFIFSFNDMDKVNPILLDRLTIIKTQGFKVDEKVKIARDYLMKEICENIGFPQDQVQVDDHVYKHMIENYANKEQGVRSLKKHLEYIVCKLNLVKLTGGGVQDPTLKTKADQGTLETMTFPCTLSKSIVDMFLKEKEMLNPSHAFMYT